MLGSLFSILFYLCLCHNTPAIYAIKEPLVYAIKEPLISAIIGPIIETLPLLYLFFILCYNYRIKNRLVKDDCMDIWINFGLALLMGIIAFGITRWAYNNNIKLLALHGRLNRLQFLIGLIGLTLVSSIFNNLISTLTENVVVLASYYAIRTLTFFGHCILLTFFYVLYARRFQDLNIHGIVGILWCLLMAFTYPYSNIKSFNFFFLLITWSVNALLLFIPGSNKPNIYGLPATWPSNPKPKRRISRRKTV